MKVLKRVLILIALIVQMVVSTAITIAQEEVNTTPVIKTLLPFNWDQGAGGIPFYYSVRNTQGEMQWSHSNWWPLLYDGRTLDELNQGEFRPGHGTVLIDTESTGNILVICHSGVLNDNPSECEQWRAIFEPENEFWYEREPTVEEQDQMNTIRLERMQSILGWRVRMLEGNAPEATFEVVGISYIPHEQVEDFRQDTKAVMEYLIPNAIDQEPWMEAVTSTDQYMIMVFCGWGPYTPETINDWSTWSRYGVLLKPINPNSDE